MITREDPRGGGPRIRRLTRRQLLAAGALAGGAVVGGAVGIMQAFRIRRDAAACVPEGYRKYELRDHFTLNPAFCARRLPSGGALAWVHRKDAEPLAYELNPEGRFIWLLCDGRRSADEIGTEFARRSGQPAELAREFLAALQHEGLVVRGGFLVAPRAFPDPRRLRSRPVPTDKQQGEAAG